MSELSSKENGAEHLDVNFWNERWLKNETGWDLKGISPPLKNYFDQIKSKDKSILIPGCGNAYEAAYLLASGFRNVTVIDIAPALIQQLLEKFSTYAGKELTVICGDFFKHSGQYDIIIEQTFFCALEKHRREEYATKMIQLLNRSGRLAGLLFDKEFENNPPFGGSKAEYTALFSSAYTILQMEACTSSAAPRLGSEIFFELSVKQ